MLGQAFKWFLKIEDRVYVLRLHLPAAVRILSYNIQSMYMYMHPPEVPFSIIFPVQVTSNGNWMHILYQSRLQAKKVREDTLLFSKCVKLPISFPGCAVDTMYTYMCVVYYCYMYMTLFGYLHGQVDPN